MDILGNVVPYISGEEEKMEEEPQKLLGKWDGSRFIGAGLGISAHCNRVPVVDGHMVATSVELEQKPSEADILAAIAGFRGVPQDRKLPSAPPQPVIYLTEPDRPQPRRDAERENGMAVFVGRLRPCPVLGIKFMALGHNTVRGAAGAALLNAELMYSEGMLD